MLVLKFVVARLASKRDPAAAQSVSPVLPSWLCFTGTMLLCFLYYPLLLLNCKQP